MKNESNNPSNKDIRKTLERELEPIKLSPQLKRDIAYNARRSKKPSSARQAAKYVWAAAAVIVLMCASLLVTGGKVFPDTRYEPVKPLAQNNTPVVTATPNTPAPTQTVAVSETQPETAAAGELVWTTENGRFHHLVQNCSGMENSLQISRSEAMVLEKQPCPLCIVFVTPIPEEALATPELTETPASLYVGTKHGLYFHLDEHCSGMKNAVQLDDLSGKQPCPVCIPSVTPTPMPTLTPMSEDMLATPEPTEVPHDYWGTPKPTPVAEDTLATPEPTEVPHDYWGTPQPTPVAEEAVATAEPTAAPINASSDVAYDASATPEPMTQQVWYGTAQDSCFHRISDCSGLGYAPQLDDLTCKLPCPYCVTYLSSYDGDVRGVFHFSDYYGTENGVFYHLDEHCSGMKNASLISAFSCKQPCPVCILNADFTPTDASATPEPTPVPDMEDITVFWAAPEGNYYHISGDCSGLENAAWISCLDDRLPCPTCIGDTFWRTSEGKFFHIEPDCSSMENAVSCSGVEAANSGKIPCPVCIGSVIETGEPVGAEINAIISLNRYTADDMCIMELEYAADAEFRFIDEPDTTNWYVDEVESPEYFFEEYLDHRLSDRNIELLKSAYEKDGKAGYEVKDTLIMLNGVNTEFSADDRDVPSGKEYRFDDTENPFRECVLYVLDSPYEGDAAEVTVVNRRMLWWFDGEKVYRLTKDHEIADEAFSVTIGNDNNVFPIHEKVGFFGIEADASGYTLGNNHYAIVEYGEDIDLSGSALISADGTIFNAEMTTDPTFHVNKVVGWRYPVEMADYISVLRLSDGESSVDIDYTTN